MPKPRPPKPPKQLGQAGKRFWRSTVAEYEFAGDPPSLVLLEQAAGTIDVIAALEAIVKEKGVVARTAAGNQKASPAMAALVANRILLSRLLRELRFTDAPEEFRAPRPTGAIQRR